MVNVNVVFINIWQKAFMVLISVTRYRWSQNLIFLFVQMCKKCGPILFAKVTIFWRRVLWRLGERGGWRSGGSSSVEGKQLLWEGRHKAGPGESGTAVKMQKHKGWPDGCAGQNPEAAGTFGKLDGSALCLLDPLSVQTWLLIGLPKNSMRRNESDQGWRRRQTWWCCWWAAWCWWPTYPSSPSPPHLLPGQTLKKTLYTGEIVALSR